MAKADDHIVPNHTVVGGYGAGNLGTRVETNTVVVPFCLPGGDKSMVHAMISADEDYKTKPQTGTLYALAKPLEKKAAPKGASLRVTASGKLKPEGAAGKGEVGESAPAFL